MFPNGNFLKFQLRKDSTRREWMSELERKKFEDMVYFQNSANDVDVLAISQFALSSCIPYSWPAYFLLEPLLKHEAFISEKSSLSHDLQYSKQNFPEVVCEAERNKNLYKCWKWNNDSVSIFCLGQWLARLQIYGQRGFKSNSRT